MNRFKFLFFYNFLNAIQVVSQVTTAASTSATTSATTSETTSATSSNTTEATTPAQSPLTTQAISNVTISTTKVATTNSTGPTTEAPTTTAATTKGTITAGAPTENATTAESTTEPEAITQVTTVGETKKVTVSGALATSVDWNDDLNNSSSALYQSTTASAKSELETLLKSSDDIQDATVTITGFEKATSSRKRRQATSSKATVKYSAECTVPESKSTDDISSSVKTAVAAADPTKFKSFDSFAGFGVKVEKAAEAKTSATTQPTSPKITQAVSEKPVNVKPAEIIPPNIIQGPNVVKPADVRPVVVVPVEVKPVVVQPAEQKPATEKPADVKPAESTMQQTTTAKVTVQTIKATPSVSVFTSSVKPTTLAVTSGFVANEGITMTLFIMIPTFFIH